MFSRILKNYERSEKSDTVLLDEIKERVLHEGFDGTSESSVSIVIYVSRAIAELFEMKSVRKRLKMGDKKVRTRVFQGLRKRIETLTQTKANTWSHMYTNAQQLAKPGWSVVKHTPDSMSFVRVENVRFDNQTVITDINLCKESGKIITNISYQKRQMARGDIDSMEKIFHAESIQAKIKLWMDYIDRSYVCQGFVVKETDEVHGDPVSKHSVTYAEDGIEETQMRGFSSNCKLLSNSKGECCSICSKTKDNLRRKHSRQEECRDRPLIPQSCNHKYMSREQLLFKVEHLQKLRTAENKKREKIQTEMLEVDVEDHEDLFSILKNVEKKDVPDDMLLFWEEQKKILETPNNRRYRWHPK